MRGHTYRRRAAVTIGAACATGTGTALSVDATCLALLHHMPLGVSSTTSSRETRKVPSFRASTQSEDLGHAGEMVAMSSDEWRNHSCGC
jgi:hypothetical protein